MGENTGNEGKLKFQLVIKEGVEPLFTVEGIGVMNASTDRDRDVLKNLFLVESLFNASNAEVRIHISLSELEAGEEVPLRRKPEYGDQPTPLRRR